MFNPVVEKTQKWKWGIGKNHTLSNIYDVTFLLIDKIQKERNFRFELFFSKEKDFHSKVKRGGFPQHN